MILLWLLAVIRVKNATCEDFITIFFIWYQIENLQLKLKHISFLDKIILLLLRCPAVKRWRSCLFQSALSLGCRDRWTLSCLCPIHAARLSIICSLYLPLPRLPSIFPVVVRCFQCFPSQYVTNKRSLLFFLFCWLMTLWIQLLFITSTFVFLCSPMVFFNIRLQKPYFHCFYFSSVMA